MGNIQKVSLLCRVLLQIVFIVLPIGVLFSWVNTPILSTEIKIMGFLINLIPAGCELLIVYFLIKLFQLYEKGEIFLIKNVTYIRNIGYILLLSQLLNPLYDALMSLLLSFHNPVGSRYISISISEINLGIVGVGFFVVLISWIMAEGCKLQEEQKLVI